MEKQDRFYRFILPLAELWLKRNFNYTYDTCKNIDGPVLVIVNHASAYDPIFTGVAFKDRALTFIASEHIVRMKTWGPFLEKRFRLIPHRKGAKGSRTALIAMKRIRKGESVFLAAEGEQTWDGAPMPVMPHTGKLVKASGATLVTFLIEGAYLSHPRWAPNKRKGKVYAHPVGIYSPEQLSTMDEAQIEQAIADDLNFDIWKWQSENPDGPVRFICKKGGNADGIERAVFTCPRCKSFGTLTSSKADKNGKNDKGGKTDKDGKAVKGGKTDKDMVRCECGFSVRLTDTGLFDQPEPFATICDWEEFDRQQLASKLRIAISTPAKAADNESGEMSENGAAANADTTTELSAPDTTIFADDDVCLKSINDDHEDEVMGNGLLRLTARDGRLVLEAPGREFDLCGLMGMTMVLSGRIVMSDKSGYYEITSGTANLRKYIIARDIARTINNENA